MEQQNLFTAAEYKKNFVKNPKAKREKKEEKLQLFICDYLRYNYPGVVWFCDLSSGAKLPIWIATLNARMRSSRGLPDLFIAQTDEKAFISGKSNQVHAGLFIEIKRQEVRLKNGNLASTPHIKEQVVIIERLRELGYRAEICCGQEEAINTITEYLGEKIC